MFVNLKGFQKMSALLMFLTLTACLPQNTQKTSEQQASSVQASSSPRFYGSVSVSIQNSCMPCHNKQTLPEVIERVQKARFQAIAGLSRERILAELEELKGAIEEGLPLDYQEKASVHQNLKSLPGELYLMLEKGQMPPRWAPELMQIIDWYYYEPLSPERRMEFLNYAKADSEKYLR